MRRSFKSNFILVTSFIVTVLCSFSLARYALDKNDMIFTVLFSSINKQHYSPVKIDDAFSQKVFNAYIQTSFNKQFLLQSDVDALNKYYNDIDDEIVNQRQDFFKATQEILNKRIAEKEAWSREILSKPFDYTIEEEYETDQKKTRFSTDNNTLRHEWEKMLKYFTLFRVDEMLSRQEKAKAKNDTSVKILSFDSLEADARRKTLKYQEDFFKRIKRSSVRDRFSEYANAVASVYDPHTQYFAPKDKKKFDQSMSGTFEGIGARLMQKDGIMKVSEIIVGSPSYKQGELKAGDEILKVAQGAGEPVDITNMDMDDAIELIKGRKGTEVRLTVKKSDNSIKVIPIIRDVIEIEETFAKSAIIDNRGAIGYIYLPAFYTNFNRSDIGAHHSSEDVRKEIEKLKKKNVKGIVLDLRDNGGGSLLEVVDMAGLFFPRGPVVQVKGKNNEPPQVLEDKNPDVAWDGPLVVMINHNSASASEILAACIQDYRRGVVIGTTSFGKGTVQSFVNLDSQLRPPFDSLRPIGDVKITQQKFYRINGGATQIKGVTPDVVLPDPYAYINYGEKEYENALPWDEIGRVNYTEFKRINYPSVIKNSQKRVKSNATFALIEQQATEIKVKKDDSRYNLNLDKYRTERREDTERNKKYEDLHKEIKGFSVNLLPEDKASDTTRVNRDNRWAKNLSKDVYVLEASNVINDIR